MIATVAPMTEVAAELRSAREDLLDPASHANDARYGRALARYWKAEAAYKAAEHTYRVAQILSAR